jgi:hypothetical protein
MLRTHVVILTTILCRTIHVQFKDPVISRAQAELRSDSARRRGIEVKGHCFGAVCGFTPTGVIDVNATSAAIQVDLVPQVLGNDVSYGNAHVSVQFNLSISGLAPPLDSIVNIAASQFRGVLASTIADNIATALMQNQARTAVAACFVQNSINSASNKCEQCVSPQLQS